MKHNGPDLAIMIAEKIGKKEKYSSHDDDSGDSKNKEMAEELLSALESKDAGKVAKVLLSMHKVWHSDDD